MTLTSPPITVAPFESGRLAAGISASATTITVSPIFKTVNGVRTKQGFDTTSGLAIISQGDFTERISFEGSSVDATTKVTTLTTCVRGLSVTSTTASFSGGTGRIWPKGAKITLVADVSYFQSVPFKNVANTFTGIQTFGMGGAVRFSGTDTSGLRVKSLTTEERDALTPANGDFIYNTTTGVMNQYIAGAWAAIGTDATANASTTVAGKVEIATAAQRAASTATGETGALLVPSNDALVKTSSGAGDENKIPVLDASGFVATGFLPTIPTAKLGSGTANSSTFLRGDQSWATPPQTYYEKIINRSTAEGSEVAANTTSNQEIDTFNYDANAWAIGDKVRIEYWGVLVANGAYTATLRPEIAGSATALPDFPITLGSGDTVFFHLTIDYNCRTTGATGTVHAAGECTFYLESGNTSKTVIVSKSAGSNTTPATNRTLDTTAALAMSLDIAFSTGSTSNKARVHERETVRSSATLF